MGAAEWELQQAFRRRERDPNLNGYYCGTFKFMAAGLLSTVRQVLVPHSAVESTLKAMRHFGSHGYEALVLWVGHVDSTTGIARVAQAFVPDQKPISSEDGVGYFVSGDTLFKLNRALSETGLRLIAQVHSHPGEAYHSEADDRYAIVTAEGGFSLVVPDFGHAPGILTAWAVYQLRDRKWCELLESEVRTIFFVEE